MPHRAGLGETKPAAPSAAPGNKTRTPQSEIARTALVSNQVEAPGSIQTYFRQASQSIVRRRYRSHYQRRPRTHPATASFSFSGLLPLSSNCPRSRRDTSRRNCRSASTIAPLPRGADSGSHRQSALPGCAARGSRPGSRFEKVGPRMNALLQHQRQRFARKQFKPARHIREMRTQHRVRQPRSALADQPSLPRLPVSARLAKPAPKSAVEPFRNAGQKRGNLLRPVAESRIHLQNPVAPRGQRRPVSTDIRIHDAAILRAHTTCRRGSLRAYCSSRSRVPSLETLSSTTNTVVRGAVRQFSNTCCTNGTAVSASFAMGVTTPK